ncbi:MAG: cold shock domain-containing protein [Sphingomonadaceae bacterium]|uniref:cold shock domain-containing protein n=1 Tax=Thermaurantiacus sp. TaxID=2820283 RepID=UPI00298F0944|nr:cold shock domain-containing protein [Thermaurantiacus sp.]MCS6987135.1 cold shock domain-containing protein [Sphingomonadaceae bacterium]MDW8415831.1 cold shock domain-containing protein [Thermaurantiacus sp.]
MARGVLLWFDAARGFGFIRPDFGPRDVFLHVSALLDRSRPPTAGQVVEFELVQLGDGRLVARRVTVLSPSQDRRPRPEAPA